MTTARKMFRSQSFKLHERKKKYWKNLKGILSLILGFIIGYQFGNCLLYFGNMYNCADNKHAIHTITEPKLQSDAISGLLYIGVLSTQKQLNTRIECAMNTWMKHVPFGVKVEVFSSNNGSSHQAGDFKQIFLNNGIRVIQLPGVLDLAYPPQKKSFSMIKFMHDFYVDKFDWFLRLDDDAYVDIDKLQKLLTRVNSSTLRYLGSLGGYRNQNEICYCMGGTGVLLSKTMLKKLAPRLKECLGNLWTEHEDIELGRCVLRATGLSCTKSWEINRIFYQHYKNRKYIENPAKAVQGGIIFHANKVPEYYYKLHKEVLKCKQRKIFAKSKRLKEDILESAISAIQLDLHVRF